MNKLTLLSVSLILLLAAFPLISLGTTGGSPALWWLGLGALVLGGLIPPATRFTARPAPATVPPPPRSVGLERDCRVS